MFQWCGKYSKHKKFEKKRSAENNKTESTPASKLNCIWVHKKGSLKQLGVSHARKKWVLHVSTGEYIYFLFTYQASSGCICNFVSHQKATPPPYDTLMISTKTNATKSIICFAIVESYENKFC